MGNGFRVPGFSGNTYHVPIFFYGGVSVIICPYSQQGWTAMIERYTRPAMGAIWTEENRDGKWLAVELAVCEAWGRLAENPKCPPAGSGPPSPPSGAWPGGRP